MVDTVHSPLPPANLTITSTYPEVVVVDCAEMMGPGTVGDATGAGSCGDWELGLGLGLSLGLGLGSGSTLEAILYLLISLHDVYVFEPVALATRYGCDWQPATARNRRHVAGLLEATSSNAPSPTCRIVHAWELPGEAS